MSLVKLQTFFVVGCPRSGTTLLQQALNRHSRVLIPPETAFLELPRLGKAARDRHLARIRRDLGVHVPVPRHLGSCDEIRRFYHELCRAYVEKNHKPGLTHFGEKSPVHLSYLCEIARLFPQAKIILVYRDGRDVALSLTRVPWTSADLYVNFALWLYCYRLQKGGEISLGARLLPVCYEHLASNPEAGFKRILVFLGLRSEPDVWQGCGNLAGIPGWEYPWKSRAAERITNSRIDLWREELGSQEIKVLERWGGRALNELGYALTTDERAPIPWWLFPRVACKSLYWLWWRPRFGDKGLSSGLDGPAVYWHPEKSLDLGYPEPVTR